jgi:transketolase
MKSFEILDNKDTRSGFGAGLLEIGKQDPRVVAMCADLTGSLVMNLFKDKRLTT